MAYDENTAGRVRRMLSGQRGIVEHKMMGGLCFMVGGSMCCGVSGAALMVRVGREAYERILAQPNVRPLEFGGRRPVGFVKIDPAGYRTNSALRRWIHQSLAFISTLPAKRPAARESPRKAPRRKR